MKNNSVLLTILVLAATVAAQSNLSLPAGTALRVKLETSLSTSSSQSGDSFSARVVEAVTLDGRTLIPRGATVQGRVTTVAEPRRIAGKPTLGIMPEAIVLPNGERYTLPAILVDTDRRAGTDVNREGQFKAAGHGGKDLTEIGLGTGGAMLAGGLMGGGEGALIGGGIGAAATVAHWLSKRKSAALPAGTELVLELSRPMAMTAASAGD
jgi:hypothetical protein